MTFRPYLVGPSRNYPTVNDALLALMEDGPELTTDVEITIAESGVYPPFSIPDGLRPSSLARLTIKADVGVVPVVDYRPFLSSPYVNDIGYGGILFHSGTKYVTLQGLHIRKASVGIYIPQDCDNIEIDRCLVYSCTKGVYANLCRELAISNSIFGDCSEYCIALNQVKNAAIVHSTLFNQQTDRPAFNLLHFQPWAKTVAGDPYGTTGLLYLYKNIFVARSGFAVECYRKDLDKIRSDLNVWWVPNAILDPSVTQTTGLAKVLEITAGGTSTEYIPALAPTLDTDDGSSWQSRTSQDMRSVSDDPVFRSSDPATASTADSPFGRPSTFVTSIYLSPNMAVDDEDLLPSFFRQSLLLEDFEQTSRLERATNGALQVEGVSSIDFDPYDDSFSDPTGEATSCQPDIASVAIETFKRAVPVWNLSLKPGPFFVRDQGFWLYGQKRAVTLAQAQRTKFALATLLVPDSVSVSVNGVDVTSTARWDIEGYTFVLYHNGLDIEFGTDVEIVGQTRVWDQATLGFTLADSTHRLKIRSGVSECVLPSVPTPGAPIVVTDDLLRPLDSLDLAQEFRVDRDPDTGDVLLEFGGARNHWANPDFAYVDESTTELLPFGLFGAMPLEHEQNGNIAVLGFTAPTGELLELVPLRAGRVLAYGDEDPTSQWVAQHLPFVPDGPWVLSLYAGSLTEQTGDLQIGVTWFDRNYDQLGDEEVFDFDVAPGSESVEFQRFGLGLWTEADATPGRPALTTYLAGAATGEPHEDTHYARIRISGRMIAIDAVQLERGFRPTAFTRIPRGDDLTIEYEEGDGILCRVKDFNLQPVRSAAGTGFLSIIPVPARQWDLSAPAGTTTLSDYRWPWGRLNLLPWAKTSGFNKYRGVAWFSTTDRRKQPEPIALDGAIGYPSKIGTTPGSITAVQGGIGVTFGVEVTDQIGNPVAFGDLRATVSDPTGEYPGDLMLREWGLPIALGPSIVEALDEAGSMSLSWLPPGYEDVQYAGAIPAIEDSTSEFGGLGAGFVRTRYRPHRLNHANARLFDASDYEIAPTGEPVTGEFFGSYSEDTDITTISLSRAAMPGTVSVFAGVDEDFDTPLAEVWSSPPLLDRQFDVDYESGLIEIRGYWEKPFLVVYSPLRLWTHPVYDRRVYISADALDEVTTEQIFVRYDAEIDVYLEALPPRGFYTHDPLGYRVSAIAQHPFRSRPPR